MAKWLPWLREPRPTEGTTARIEAQQHLEHHRAQRHEVREVAESLRSIRLRNHFSEQIKDLIEETR